ncbi:hypothetical protein ACFYW6_17745 [Streptomyces sp. NPDC002659]|uniref:hypothetical protein n=1 Tax=Streptomyces sp. NPDC002659 TaxID=3364656 RepID=UPI0036C63500
MMFDLAGKLEFTATSEGGRVLDALAHAQRHQAARGEYISALGEDGCAVDISFATQNWQKAVVDKTRTGQFVRKHFEAMVFTSLAEELRTGDVAALVSGMGSQLEVRNKGRGSAGRYAWQPLLAQAVCAPLLLDYASR